MDIRVENCGSIVTFEPLTDAGWAFVNENVQSESWQWLGGRLAVDWRYAEPLVDGMQAEGLRING